MNKAIVFLSREKVIQCVYILISIGIGLQHYKGGVNKYNNFVIFRQSFFHLLEGKNLYIAYPNEYFDLFLYHPTFAILFSVFSVMPMLVSLLLWLIGCSLILFYAIKYLPILEKQKVFMWWFVLIELTTSLHNQQTNPIIAALGLFTFIFLEKKQVKWAALFPVLAFCIKGYGAIFAVLFIFYPKKKAFLFYSILWALMLAFLPLSFTGWEYFLQVNQDWVASLIGDHEVNFGLSIMGLCNKWFNAFSQTDALRVQIFGLILFGVTWFVYFKESMLSQCRRMLLLGYAMLWVIIFNHTSESPTFIIAIVGVGLFYVALKPSLGVGGTLLILFVFIFSILAPTDIYPLKWRQQFFVPYLVKVIPCVVVWVVLQVRLFGSVSR